MKIANFDKILEANNVSVEKNVIKETALEEAHDEILLTEEEFKFLNNKGLDEILDFSENLKKLTTSIRDNTLFNFLLESNDIKNSIKIMMESVRVNTELLTGEGDYNSELTNNLYEKLYTAYIDNNYE